MLGQLTTERLVLREFVIGDAPFVVELLNQPSFIQFIGDKSVRTRADAEQYLKTGPLDSYRGHGFGLYLVQLRDSHEPIGMCGLLKRDALPQPDLGFAFLPEYWGKGYAFEAASAVVAQARDELGIPLILAITNPDNQSSIKLLERLGFHFEHLIRLPDEVKLFSLTG